MARFVATSFFAAAGVLASIVPVASTPAATAAESGWIDTWDRAAVLAAWDAEFDRVEPPMAATGTVATCTPGTTSPVYRASVLQRVNWYRAMAGLTPVVESAAASTAAQSTATMMAAQGDLSHAPGPAWACRTTDGAATAGKSNLALGMSGVAAIDGYMQDFGANNLKVGHRRTILYPQVQEMGTGDVASTAGNWAANALQVFDSHLWDPRPAVREGRGFVAWPPSGYVPADTVWDRWSFSLARADFSTASVTVTGPDGAEPVTVLARIQSAGLIAPEATLVFAVGGDDNSSRWPTPRNGDECYDVTVSGVSVSGVAADPFHYSTCLLDPTWTPPTPPGEVAAVSASTCPSLTFTAWTTPCWSTGTVQWMPFQDISAGWQFGPVNWLLANSITTGTSTLTFSPDGAVDRAQAATFIWRLAGSPAPPTDAPNFTDVQPDAYYHDAVRWMAAYGITTGTSKTTFDPGRTATRAELVTFLWRLVDRPDIAPSGFTDLSADWQVGPVAWAAANGITNGTSSTTFSPDVVVTRGQTAALLSRFAAALTVS